MERSASNQFTQIEESTPMGSSINIVDNGSTKIPSMSNHRLAGKLLHHASIHASMIRRNENRSLLKQIESDPQQKQKREYSNSSSFEEEVVFDHSCGNPDFIESSIQNPEDTCDMNDAINLYAWCT